MSQKSGFSRVLTKREVLALAFGAMIGWGWVVLAGEWIREAGSFGAMFAFIIGGLLVTFVGLTYAELASAMPKAGGELLYSYRGLGLLPSFICSWTIILGYISVVSFEAVALPTVVEYLFPNYMQGYLWTVAGWDVYASWALVGIAGSIVLCVVNYLGIKMAAFMQTVFTLVIAAAGIMLITGSLFTGSTVNMQPLLTGGMAGLFTVIIMTPFMFVGFDVIPQAAEEMDIPRKSIGKILIISVLMASAWYVLIIFGVSRALSPAELQNTGLATADAMTALFGGVWAGKLLVLAGIAGIITSWNGFYIGASRLIYAMARAKMLPEFLGRLHPKYKTPYNAIILIGILSSIAPLFGKKMLVWLVNAGGLGVVVAYLAVALSFLVLRYREPDMARPFTVSKGKLVGFIAVLMSIGMALMYLPGSPSALAWPYEWVIVLGWLALGVAFYAAAKMKHGDEASRLLHERVHDNM
ncbi:MAG: APC family permease [Firmicutes bacterium]|nr:APC family permease [Bacillota bacterium]